MGGLSTISSNIKELSQLAALNSMWPTFLKNSAVICFFQECESHCHSHHECRILKKSEKNSDLNTSIILTMIRQKFQPSTDFQPITTLPNVLSLVESFAVDKIFHRTIVWLCSGQPEGIQMVKSLIQHQFYTWIFVPSGACYLTHT